jgi:UDP-N-acetylmuramoylalanine--D-glutamate ligase
VNVLPPELIRGQRVLVLGYGKEGRSTLRALAALGGARYIDIADMAHISPHPPGARRCVTGKGYLDVLDRYDIVFKSPGVALPREPAGYGCHVTSQTELFLAARGAQTIGVTGTKGKSTVTTIIRHALAANGVDCVMAGNIGIPFFDAEERIGPKTVVAAELSCHQLEHCAYSPHTALLLNLFEDHLDRYGIFERYAAAKANIYKHQPDTGIFFCPPDCGEELAPPGTVQALAECGLIGKHNLANCAFAYAACALTGISPEDFVRALRSYKPLPHRLEFIGNAGGVDYYDDSISTTAESAVSAAQSVANISVLILGGMDRGIDYSALVDFLPRSGLRGVVLMYASGKRIHGLLSAADTRGLEVVLTEDLEGAVAAARRIAPPGSAVVLSPAAASYGAFRDFTERGKAFAALALAPG